MVMPSSKNRVQSKLSRQETFLKSFAVTNSVRKSAEKAGITRDSHRNWIRNDKDDFRTRFADAKEDFKEYLQDMMLDRVKAQKPGDNPVLLIAMANANIPEKFRPSTIVTDGTAKEVMAEWKQWVKDAKKTETASEVPAEIEEREAELEVRQLFDRKFNGNITDGASK
jgi:hypothetical protein